MGSACLFFALRPKNALLADINGDLVGTFMAVRDHPQAVANRLARMPLGKRSYYSIRKQRLCDLEPVEAAVRFIFLNRFCFNGLYRTNEMGRFNVPFGSAGTGRVPTASELRIVAKALGDCTIMLVDVKPNSLLLRRLGFVVPVPRRCETYQGCRTGSSRGAALLGLVEAGRDGVVAWWVAGRRKASGLPGAVEVGLIFWGVVRAGGSARP